MAALTNGDGLAHAQRVLIGQLALKNHVAAAVFMREVTPGFFYRMDRTFWRSVAGGPCTLIGFSSARDLVNFPWSSRQNSSSLSISRPRMHSALTFRL
jgi:hypothetical protein